MTVDARDTWTRSASSVTLTTFNMENLFDLITEPGERRSRRRPTAQSLEVKLRKLALAVRLELRCPEVLVAQEVDNEAILQELGDRVNGAEGTSYRAVSYETSDRRSMEIGFLYDEARVQLCSAYQLSGPEVDRAFGRSSANPGREPLVGVFEAHGTSVTVVGNHFKSKVVPVSGAAKPVQTEGATESQRRKQARVVRGFVDRLLEADPEHLIVVAGDFNDYRFREPKELDGQPIAIIEGGPDDLPLVDVVGTIPEADRYTYIFGGVGQVLDHIFLSPAAWRRFGDAMVLHFNAGHPRRLGDDETSPTRASDHDPVELRLDLDPARQDCGKEKAQTRRR